VHGVLSCEGFAPAQALVCFEKALNNMQSDRIGSANRITGSRQPRSDADPTKKAPQRAGPIRT